MKIPVGTYTKIIYLVVIIDSQYYPTSIKQNWYEYNLHNRIITSRSLYISHHNWHLTIYEYIIRIWRDTGNGVIS